MTPDSNRLDLTAQQVIENMLEGVMITDVHQSVLAVNSVFSSVTGYASADIVGKTPRLLQSGRHKPAFYRKMWSQLEKTGLWQGEIQNRRKNGEIYTEFITITAIRDADDRVVNYMAVFADITKQKRAQETIRHMAYYDSLTDLPNRTFFREQLRHAIAQAARRHELLGVLFFDLDRLKLVNDTLGHDMGDRLLIGVAERLKTALRETDVVARLGGDEFMVLLSGLTDVNEIKAIADKVLNAVRPPFHFGEHELYTTASIGVSIYPYDGVDVDALLKNADTAMYRAKHRGRNTFEVFDQAMKAEVFQQLTLGNALRRALDRKEFVVHYQPQIDIATGQIVGAEALVRWNHPERGLISPTAFIHWAEDSGLIVPIGEMVLRLACREARGWLSSGHDHLKIGVNLSARQFRQSDIVGTVEAVLKDTRLPPDCLDLELTESVIMEIGGGAASVPHALRAMGVGFSIDDFGTGYSSLSYLKQLPVNALKLDPSFVRDLTVDPNDAAIANAVIGLGHGLDLAIVAEGVETEGQLDHLRRLKCDRMQGFLFSRPLPAEEFDGLLRDKRHLRPATLFDQDPN